MSFCDGVETINAREDEEDDAMSFVFVVVDLEMS